MAKNDDKESEKGWVSTLVDLFAKPLSGPVSELSGIAEDYLRVARYRRRAKLLKELEEDGLLGSDKTELREIVFKNDPNNQKGADE